jgi:hypothetical protein
MIVSDIDKSMYERFIKIYKTQFNLCNNIHPIFTNSNEIIRGEIVNFYHDKVENRFLLSIDWQNPLSILEISYDLSSLLSAVRLEKEIMMLLSMSYSQIEQFLIFQKLDFKEYHNSEIYKEILNEIKKLEELKSIKPIKKLEKGNDTSSTNIKNDEDVPVEVKPLSGSMDETQEEIEAEQPKPKTIKDIIPDVSEKDEAYIKGIINFSYDTEGQMDANTTAKIKTLVAIKNKYATFNISDEGRFLKAGSDEILVRSAQNGLLYLDVYHWGRLNEANVRLSVYTKNLIEIFDSQEQLILYTKPQNKFGIVRMPNEYNLEDYNSLDNIPDKGKWHYVFIVNEKTKAAQNYKDVMNLDDYNF